MCLEILNTVCHYCFTGLLNLLGSKLLLIFFWEKISPKNIYHLRSDSLHKKWSFPVRISSVYVTKPAVSCVFGHIYWRNPSWKTSIFVQWFQQNALIEHAQSKLIYHDQLQKSYTQGIYYNIKWKTSPRKLQFRTQNSQNYIISQDMPTKSRCCNVKYL